MQLVLLALQVVEEAPHTPPLIVTLEDVVLLRGRQVLPRNVQRNPRRSRVALHLRTQRLVFRLGPRLDCAFCQRKGLVRDHQVEVEIDGIPESLALRTCAIGIVEREQTGLRLFVFRAIVLALKTLREAKPLDRLIIPGNRFENDLACLTISLLDRIDYTRPHIRSNYDSVNDDIHRLGEVHFQQCLRSREVDDFVVLIEAQEPALAQFRQPFLQQGVVFSLGFPLLCRTTPLRLFGLGRLRRRLQRK